MAYRTQKSYKRNRIKTTPVLYTTHFRNKKKNLYKLKYKTAEFNHFCLLYASPSEKRNASATHLTRVRTRKRKRVRWQPCKEHRAMLFYTDRATCRSIVMTLGLEALGLMGKWTIRETSSATDTSFAGPNKLRMRFLF